MTPNELLSLTINILEENKGVDIEPIDVTSLTDVTDFMVICSATSSRHARTLASKVVRTARDQGIRALSVEGEQDNEWILIDFADVVVHIMLPEAREYYNLEKLWAVTESARSNTAG